MLTYICTVETIKSHRHKIYHDGGIEYFIIAEIIMLFPRLDIYLMYLIIDAKKRGMSLLCNIASTSFGIW